MCPIDLQHIITVTLDNPPWYHDSLYPTAHKEALALVHPTYPPPHSRHCYTCNCACVEEESDGYRDYDHLPSLENMGQTHAKLVGSKMCMYVPCILGICTTVESL